MLALLASVAPVHAKTNPSDLAAYVRARAADADGKAAMASSGYANALEAAPGDAVIALRAYRAAITAGDFVVLNRARMVLERANLAPADAALLALAEAVRDNDTAATQKAIDRIKTGPLDFLAPAFRAWAAMADPAAALTALDSVGTNPIERRYAQESSALLLLAAGKVDQGADLVRVMLGADRASIDLRIAAAQILADSGRSDVSDGLFAGPDKSLLAVRQSIGKGRRATTAIGISYVLGRLSADLNDGQSGRLLIVMVRAALRLDPQNDRARLVLAEALAADDNPTMALAALDEIPASSPLKEIAAQRRIALLERGGNAAAALAAAARIAEKKGYLELDDQPARIMPYTPSELAASTYSSPTLMFDRIRSAWKGTTAHTISATVKVMIGASRNSPLFALDGMIVSCRNTFRPSANDCRMPNGPTTLGPRRNAIAAQILRSA